MIDFLSSLNYHKKAESTIMKINESCMGGAACPLCCIQGVVFSTEDALAAVDLELCVECGVCVDADICPPPLCMSSSRIC